MSRPVSGIVVPPDERDNRALAIDPRQSVFLAANAGSGKTTILTSRVIRILLEGFDPSGILCLTYTKAAAVEMQHRVFATLSEWVSLDDSVLAGRITALTERTPGERELRAARRLFTRAVEAPGGLKIQTIHAFAERLLHLFPFEANVPANFTTLDELSAAELTGEAQRAVFRDALRGPDTPIGRAFGAFSRSMSESDLGTRLEEARRLLRSGALIATISASEREERLRTVLELEPDDSIENVAAEMFPADWPGADWSQVLAIAEIGNATEVELAASVRAAARESDPLARIMGITGALTYTASKKHPYGAPKAKLLSVANARKHPAAEEFLVAESARVSAMLDRALRLVTLHNSAHLWTLADAVEERFAAAKRERGLVDFDDIIARCDALLTGAGASWVLCKLDGGLTHVLVDEAQDTSPRMWSIVDALTEEFHAGEGAARAIRTVFVVGDEKQSIYSFQGARPEAFDHQRRHYRTRFRQAGLGFVEKPLRLSFRSAHGILAAVDQVFDDPARRVGLTADGIWVSHETARVSARGYVEIWPLVEAPVENARDPTEEVDVAGVRSAPVRLARDIAAHISGLIAEGRFETDGAPIRPGDIMILVRRRNALFDAIIRALKDAGVPVAGADRIRLSEQIAVLDLLAAARAALLPEDDLSVAEVLKGPLAGLGDDDLIALAPLRTGSLFDALALSDDPRHRAAHERIKGWSALARDRVPSAFFATILAAEGGRRALLSRLGPDAGEAIDVFLAHVRNYERSAPASLTSFLAAFAAYDGDVKRDQEQAGDSVRVLTVHGAKGLEARIVYLPDTTGLPHISNAARVFAVDGAMLAYSGDARPCSRLREARAGERQAAMAEYRRLLYVALTRARERLYVAGTARRSVEAGNWYHSVAEALLPTAREVTGTDGRTVWRWPDEPLPVPDAVPSSGPASISVPLPDWIASAVPSPPVPARLLWPSRIGERIEPDLEQDRAGHAARRRGILVHAVIEAVGAIGPDRRSLAADALLQRQAMDVPEPERRAIAAEALSLLNRLDEAGLSGPGMRVEVPLAGPVRLGDGTDMNVTGRLDRLLVRPDRIVVVDIKTGFAAGGARAYAGQLALYRALLAGIYPGRPIECCVAWTASGKIETVPEHVLDAALATIKQA